MFVNLIRGMLVVTLVRVVALSDPGPEDKLTLRLELHKTEVIVGEPVLITATAENEGSEPLELIYHNAPTLREMSVVDLRLGTDENQMKRWSGELRPAERVQPRILRPGESVTVEMVMLFNRRNGFFAESTGTFWIAGRAVIRAKPYIEVLTTPIKIEVREPPRADRATWAWLDAKKEEYGRLIQIPWMAKLSEEFVRECANTCDTSHSTYAEYLALSLSRWYREGPRKDVQQATRFAEIAKERASSERILAEAEKLLPHSKPKGAP